MRVRIPSLPFLALLLSVCVAPMAAQSSPDKSPASQSQLDGLVAPPEFRANVPAPGHIAREGIRPTPARGLTHLRFSLKSEQDDTTCFYIRSYRVTRDDPKSDATRPTGYSTCQPATRFQTKSAVEIREFVPR